MAANIKLTDNFDEIKQNFTEQIKLALDDIGNAAEGYAAQDAPVDTGRLRNSIVYKLGENKVKIGSDLVYAPPQEFNSYNHKSGRAHFLRDAITTHNEEYMDMIAGRLSQL